MSTPDEIRINARLTGEDARRFQELQQLEQQSVSWVLREAVREYHVKRIKPRRSAYEIMQERGFIGRYAAAGDSSDRAGVQRAMDAVLRAKYPEHFSDAKPDAELTSQRKAL